MTNTPQEATMSDDMTDERAVPPAIEVDEGRVILRGELAGDVIYDVSSSSTPYYAEFLDQFVIDPKDYPGNPNEDYYQGMSFTRVIQRKSDGRRFGFTYWKDISKHGESFVESNADEHGIEVEYDANWEPIGGEPYVFLPVEPFTVIGYEVKA